VPLQGEREQCDNKSEGAERDHQCRHFWIRQPRGKKFGQPVQTDRRAEHDRKHDRRSDSEAAPHALWQVALQHSLVRMQRIVIDHDDVACRIFRDGLRHLEIAEVFADADAVVAPFLAGDGIFVDDVCEVALFDLASARAIAVHHRDVAHFSIRDHHLARRRRPFAGGARLPCLVSGGNENEAERREQYRIDEPRHIRHWIFPTEERAAKIHPLLRRAGAANGSMNGGWIKDLLRPRQRQPDAAADHKTAGDPRHQPRPFF
jgi:hypothetical protein